MCAANAAPDEELLDDLGLPRSTIQLQDEKSRG